MWTPTVAWLLAVALVLLAAVAWHALKRRRAAPALIPLPPRADLEVRVLSHVFASERGDLWR